MIYQHYELYKRKKLTPQEEVDEKIKKFLDEGNEIQKFRLGQMAEGPITQFEIKAAKSRPTAGRRGGNAVSIKAALAKNSLC